jgi:hypothetical protein
MGLKVEVYTDFESEEQVILGDLGKVLPLPSRSPRIHKPQKLVGRNRWWR